MATPFFIYGIFAGVSTRIANINAFYTPANGLPKSDVQHFVSMDVYLIPTQIVYILLCYYKFKFIPSTCEFINFTMSKQTIKFYFDFLNLEFVLVFLFIFAACLCLRTSNNLLQDKLSLPKRVFITVVHIAPKQNMFCYFFSLLAESASLSCSRPNVVKSF